MKSLLLFFLTVVTFQFSNLQSAPLNGTYIIGPTGDYATIGGAVAAVVTEGVSGPVIFRLMTGTYSEVNTITAVPFASTVNPVMFESMAGDPDSVIISSPSGNAFNIQGAAYLIFRRLTMQSINITGECREILITNNNFKVGSMYYNIGMDDGFVNILTITNNTGLNGILFGSPDVSNDVNIINNTFGSPFAYAIISHISGLKFQTNNNIFNMNLNSISEADCSGNIISSNSPGSYAMTIEQCSDIVISSNFVQSDQNSFPVRLEGNEALQFLSNTVRSDNTDTSIICYNNTDIKFENNIYKNENDGYAISYVGNNDLSSDYNSYFNNDPDFIIRYNGTSYSLGSFKAATGLDSNSVLHNVIFAGANDLHLHASESGNPLLVGIPHPLVTVDIDGEIRNLIHPYKGADELDTPLPVELSSFTSSITNNTVTLRWTTTHEQNNQGFEIQRSSDDDQWTLLSFVNGQNNSGNMNSYFYEDGDLNSGSYNYRLKQVDYNGAFEYYNLSNEVIIGLPQKYDLSQNYPNPFNPTTRISFSIPKAGLVTMKIYDLLGKEVMSLVNEQKVPGVYDVEFNGASLASGAYFYRISAGEFTAIRRMLLIK